ncbi:MAG: hypothetical protein E6Y31_09810 [Clostridium perfringens]|nr:hypothetical protein [Clostridium perfringens]MDU4829687.1 hypothetical protein [Clostridium perfringens]
MIIISEDKKCIFKEILIKTTDYTIGVDELLNIRIHLQPTAKSKDLPISKFVKLVMEINILPMSEKERHRYKRDIANIYQIGFEEDEASGVEYAQSLKQMIERNLLIQRKKDLFQPAIIGFLIIMIITSIPFFNHYISDFYFPIFYGSIGGILSIIIQNNKFNIDYQVDEKLLKFESAKLILVSNIMAIIGLLVIKSEIVLSNITKDSSPYFIYLIYVLCGYSQTFIPNLLKNFESTTKSK